jgi:hypothetical protein
MSLLLLCDSLSVCKRAIVNMWEQCDQLGRRLIMATPWRWVSCTIPETPYFGPNVLVKLLEVPNPNDPRALAAPDCDGDGDDGCQDCIVDDGCRKDGKFATVVNSEMRHAIWQNLEQLQRKHPGRYFYVAHRNALESFKEQPDSMLDYSQPGVGHRAPRSLRTVLADACLYPFFDTIITTNHAVAEAYASNADCGIKCGPAGCQNVRNQPPSERDVTMLVVTRESVDDIPADYTMQE